MRYTRRAMVWGLGMVLAVAATSGCWWRTRGGVQPATIRLLVSNRTYYDVNVFVLRSVGGPAYRLDTVTGNAEVELRVRTSDLGPTGELIVQCHAIGSRYEWTSPPVQVDSSVVAHLELYSDAYGNLNRSNLYTVIAEGSP